MTETEQLPALATGAVQPLPPSAIWNCVASPPNIATLGVPVAAAPIFVRVKVSGPLTWEIHRLGKAKLEGVTESCADPTGKPVPERADEAVTPAPVVALSVAASLPTPLGENVTATVQVWPVPSGSVQVLTLRLKSEAFAPLRVRLTVLVVQSVLVTVNVTAALDVPSSTEPKTCVGGVIENVGERQPLVEPPDEELVVPLEVVAVVALDELPPLDEVEVVRPDDEPPPPEPLLQLAM